MWLFWACAIYEWREADSRQVCGCLATRPSPSLRSPVDPEVAYPNIFPCANMLPNFLLDKLNFVSKMCFVRFCSIFFYIIKVNSFCYKRQLGMIHFFDTLRDKNMKIMIYCSSVFKPLLVRRNPKQKYKQTCLCCRQLVVFCSARRITLHWDICSNCGCKYINSIDFHYISKKSFCKRVIPFQNDYKQLQKLKICYTNAICRSYNKRFTQRLGRKFNRCRTLLTPIT